MFEDDFEIDSDEVQGPEPGDYVLSPSGRLGSKTAVSIVEGKFLGEYDDEDVAEKAICRDMKSNKHYPNVWRLSDHGNVEPTSVSCKVKY